MKRTPGLVLVLGLLAGPQGLAASAGVKTRDAKPRKLAPSPPKPGPEPAPRVLAPVRQRADSHGTVSAVSAGLAYLDRGKDEGLVAGMEVAFSRRGKAVGTCRVEWAADHHASCQTQALRPGDQFTLSAQVEPPAPAPRPAPVPEAQLARWRAALQSAPQALVEFHSEQAHRRSATEALVGHTSWVSTRADSSFHQEWAQVSLRGLPLAGGLRVYLDATALAWTGRPTEYRALARSSAQLYVREGEVVSREAGSSLALAVGRVWPWYVPGVPVFDGAQAGWRSPTGDFEVGGFGGAIPDPVSLAPSFERLAAGAYLAGRHTGGEAQALRMLQYETRVSYLSAPANTKRVEVEGRARLWLWRSTDVGLWARLGLGDAQAPAGVDAARVDVELRPSERWRVSGGVRYDGNLALDVPALEGLELGSRALHGDVSATWQPVAGFSAGLTGVAARDIHMALGRQLVGPELGWPQLFGSRGGLSLGYLEELGWQRGRSGYVQTVLQASSAVRVLGRLSYFEDSAVPGVANALPAREAGLYTSADYAPNRWFGLRASLLARVGIDAQPSFGLMGSASLTGRF